MSAKGRADGEGGGEGGGGGDGGGGDPVEQEPPFPRVVHRGCSIVLPTMRGLELSRCVCRSHFDGSSLPAHASVNKVMFALIICLISIWRISLLCSLVFIMKQSQLCSRAIKQSAKQQNNHCSGNLYDQQGGTCQCRWSRMWRRHSRWRRSAKSRWSRSCSRRTPLVCGRPLRRTFEHANVSKIYQTKSPTSPHHMAMQNKETLTLPQIEENKQY